MRYGYVQVRTRDGAELQDDGTWKIDADPAFCETEDELDDLFQLACKRGTFCHSRTEYRELIGCDDTDPKNRSWKVLSRTV